MPLDNEKKQLWLHWLHERQRIYLRRQAGNPRPWTTDPILRCYRFTCVYREDDRTTAWIRDNWRKPYADHKNLWFACCIARQINWPDTLAELGFPEKWDADRAYQILRSRKDRGAQVYTNAYKLVGTTAKGDKIRYTVWDVLDNVFRKADLRQLHKTTLQSATEYLSTFFGFGGFLAYEVITDLRHTRYLRHAPDILTWANAGPGAQRGLNRLFSRPVERKLDQYQALEEMQRLMIF